jgi:xanthine dehydrogenase large subunit
LYANWERGGRLRCYLAYSAAVSEVETDTLTGEYRLLRVDILDDWGAALDCAAVCRPAEVSA